MPCGWAHRARWHIGHGAAEVSTARLWVRSRHPVLPRLPVDTGSTALPRTVLTCLAGMGSVLTAELALGTGGPAGQVGVVAGPQMEPASRPLVAEASRKLRAACGLFHTTIPCRSGVCRTEWPLSMASPGWVCGSPWRARQGRGCPPLLSCVTAEHRHEPRAPSPVDIGIQHLGGAVQWGLRPVGMAFSVLLAASAPGGNGPWAVQPLACPPLSLCPD